MGHRAGNTTYILESMSQNVYIRKTTFIYLFYVTPHTRPYLEK